LSGGPKGAFQGAKIKCIAGFTQIDAIAQLIGIKIIEYVSVPNA